MKLQKFFDDRLVDAFEDGKVRLGEVACLGLLSLVKCFQEVSNASALEYCPIVDIGSAVEPVTVINVVILPT